MPRGIASSARIGGGINAGATVSVAALGDSAVIAHWAIRPHGIDKCDDPVGDGDGFGSRETSRGDASSAQCRSLASAWDASDIIISCATACASRFGIDSQAPCAK